MKYLIFVVFSGTIDFLNFKNTNDLLIKTTSNVQIRENIKKYDYNKYSNYYSILEKYEKNFKWLSKEM